MAGNFAEAVRPNGTENLVLFIHGFMGGPAQFDDWMCALYAHGYACVAVLLPGHGGDAREFGRNGAADWARHLQAEIEKLRDSYARIFLVGHSMGGLLALQASLISENKIAGVFLIATPLKLRIWQWRSLGQRVRLLGYPQTHAIKIAYSQANSIGKLRLFPLSHWGKPLRGLFSLMKTTKACLADVFVPVAMLHSKNDETTAFASSQLLQDGLCHTRCEAWRLETAWHAYYTEADRAFIAEKLVAFIDGVCYYPGT